MQVKIHYTRLPDHTTIFHNELVQTTDQAIVTIMRATPLARPLIINGRTVLEAGAPAVWFTFPGADHDIGRFHTARGEFTGIYANVLTPVEFLSACEWRTTDLFVDVWLDANGTVQVLDEDELAAAREHGWIDEATAQQALHTAHRLLAEHANGTWPPQVVYEWPLERIYGR